MENMVKPFYDIFIIGFVVLVGFGFSLVFDYYQQIILPLELSKNYFDRIMVSSDPQSISTDLITIKSNLPKDGNPVLVFSTPSTDFGLIQQDLDSMIVNVEKISTLPRDSSSFHTGIEAISDRAFDIQQNLEDVKSYMYVSVSNVFFNFIWIIGGMGLVQSIIRRYN